MYDYFEGTLKEKTPTYVVIDCNGIGYIINISLNTYSALPNPSSQKNNAILCKLFTYLVVKEDALTLFGFINEDERRIFKQLLSVSGIGANTARMILSSLSPKEVFQAIATSNSSVFQSIKGIGAKTAQQIILDLQNKIKKDDISKEIFNASHNTVRDEALSGLIQLGFAKNVAEKAIDKVILNNHANASKEHSALTIETLIKEALKII